MSIKNIWPDQLKPLLVFVWYCFLSHTFLMICIFGLTTILDLSMVGLPLLFNYQTTLFDLYTTHQQMVEFICVTAVTIYCIGCITLDMLWLNTRTRIETNLIVQTYRNRYIAELTNTDVELHHGSEIYSYFGTAVLGLQAFIDGYGRFILRIVFAAILCVPRLKSTGALILWILGFSILGIIQNCIYISTVSYSDVKSKKTIMQRLTLDLWNIISLTRERRQEKEEEERLRSVIDGYINAHNVYNRKFVIDHIWQYFIFLGGLFVGWFWFKEYNEGPVPLQDLIWSILLFCVFVLGYLNITTRSTAILVESLLGIKNLMPILKHPQNINNEKITQRLGPARISVINATYTADNTELINVTAMFPKNSVIGLVATGNEAETLINLILKKIIPSSGSITVDYDKPSTEESKNIEIRAMHLRAEPILIPRSIMDNFNYGLTTSVPVQELADIVELLEISSLISRLPKGLNTILDATTIIHLSNSEKQRLVIGRALLSRAPILIFNNAMSDIELRLKSKIVNYITNQPKVHTTLIVTGALPILQNVDTIYVFHKGHLVETGQHQELLNRNGIYLKLYFAQAKLGLVAQNPIIRKV